MIFITFKVLNLVRSARNRLRPVWITFVWNCLPCFSNTKIGSVTRFSILFNFQGPVRLSLSADDLFILPPKWFFVKSFFEAFELSELKSFSRFSELTGTFERSLVLFKGFLLGLRKSFFCLSAWRSSIIPHPGAVVNTFWHLFSNFFAGQISPLLFSYYNNRLFLTRRRAERIMESFQHPV